MATIVHAEAKHYGQTKTIPLAAHAGANRQAVVVVGWQGQQHNGGGNMGSTPGVFEEVMRQPWPTDYTPAVAVWKADIPTGTSDVDVPYAGAGGGWQLWVLEGLNLASVTATANSNGFGTSAGVSGQGADISLGAVAVSANSTVSLSGTGTLTKPTEDWWSEVSGVSAIPGGNATFGWGGDTQFAVVTVTADAVAGDPNQWTHLATTAVRNVTVVGSGLGTDVDTTDTNGIEITTGEIGEYIDKWRVSPDSPAEIGYWRKRMALPADYDPTEGYSISLAIEDSAGNVIAPAQTMTPVGGGPAGIIGGETTVFELTNIDGLVWPGDGSEVWGRFLYTPTPVATLRPVTPPVGGVAGRLARPRRVELWRSQGGGGIPTLTTADRYVDPQFGSDGNNGLTRGTAWRTMGHAMDQTSGQGLAVGYLSGNLPQFTRNSASNLGSGTNFTTRMATHYALQDEVVTIVGDFMQAPAIWLKHMSYLQFSGFRGRNTNNANGGIEYASMFNIDAYDGTPNDTHHFVLADMVVERFNSSGMNGLGTRYVRVLGCEVYDCGWWHNGGASGTTWNDTDRAVADTTPVGYVDGKAIDVWIEGCYISGVRQKTDSSDIGGAGSLWDGNAFMVDYAHVHTGETIRVCMVNNIAHNTGGKGFNSYQGADELFLINNASFYAGRHKQYVQTPGDPVQGMDPAGQLEYVVQSYSSNGGKATTVHYWNNVAVAGSWMSGSPAFGAWGDRVTINARNNKRHGVYSADSYSTVMADPNIVNSDQNDGTVFDPRPLAGSPLLTGGDLSLLTRAGVSTDFAGNPFGSSGNGHVGPYSQPVTP